MKPNYICKTFRDGDNKIMVIGIKNNLEGIMESKIGLTDLTGWGKLVRAAILKSEERASN